MTTTTSDSASSFSNGDQKSLLREDHNNKNDDGNLTSTISISKKLTNCSHAKNNEQKQKIEIHANNDDDNNNDDDGHDHRIGINYESNDDNDDSNHPFMLTQLLESHDHGEEGSEEAAPSANSASFGLFITQHSYHDDNHSHSSSIEERSVTCDDASFADNDCDDDCSSNHSKEVDSSQSSNKNDAMNNNNNNNNNNNVSSDKTLTITEPTVSDNNDKEENQCTTTKQLNNTVLLLDDKFAHDHGQSGFTEDSCCSSNNSCFDIDHNNHDNDDDTEGKIDHDNTSELQNLQKSNSILYRNIQERHLNELTGFTEDSQAGECTSDEKDRCQQIVINQETNIPQDYDIMGVEGEREREVDIEGENEEEGKEDIVRNFDDGSTHNASQDIQCHGPESKREECNNLTNDKMEGNIQHSDNKIESSIEQAEKHEEKQHQDEDEEDENMTKDYAAKKSNGDSIKDEVVNDTNDSIDDNYTSMTPVYVYNGITQSLPTQLNHTSVEQCHDDEGMKKATGHDSQPSIRNETNDQHQYQLDYSNGGDSIYAASTEVLQSSLEYSKSQSSPPEETPLNQINQINIQSRAALELKTPDSNMQHVQDAENSILSNDTLYNKSTVPLQTPLKSQLEDKVADSSPYNTKSQDTTTTVETCTENKNSCMNNLNDTPNSPTATPAKLSQSKDTVLDVTMVQRKNIPFSSPPQSKAETLTLDQQNDSEETKTVTGDDLLSPLKQSPKKEKSECSKLEEKQKSLLGPTPTIDTLSYPEDYAKVGIGRTNYHRPRGVSLYGDNKNNNIKEISENHCVDEIPVGANNSIGDSHTMAISQDLLTSPQEKASKSVSTKVPNKSTFNDDIFDSDGEEIKDKEISKSINNLNKRRNGTSLSFLPPSPGKRQDYNDGSIKAVDHFQMKKKKPTFADDINQNQHLSDEIVEEPSQAELALKIDFISGFQSNDKKIEKKVDECTLTDTQPDAGYDKQMGFSSNKQYKRIRRGIENNILDENCDNETMLTENNESEGEESDKSMANLYSQTTCDIKSMLQNLKEVNINDLKQNLANHPTFTLKKAQEEIDSITKKNKKLQESNKRHKEENNKLKRKLEIANVRLEEKSKLCEEMKSQLEELQPLIDVLKTMSGKKQEKNTPKNKVPSKTKRSLNQTSEVQNYQEEGDKESAAASGNDSDDEQRPRRLTFQTPKTARREENRKNVGVVTISGRKTRLKKRAKGNVTFQVLWRLLQKSGWKYKPGPEPYDNVYVPPNGGVSMGSVLGQDFFHADESLWKRAEELGIIDKYSPSDVSQDSDISDESDSEQDECNQNPEKLVCVSSPESEANELLNIQNNIKSKRDTNLASLDDTKLCSPSFVITKRSASKCSNLMVSFLSMKTSERKFMKDLWIPLWNCIKDEQGSGTKGLCWRYDKSIGAGPLGRDFWYCPPGSVVGSKGEFGKDYFTNEEEVVSFLLRDLKAIGEVSIIHESMHELVTNFEMKLSRAIEDHFTFDEVESAFNGTQKRRRKKTVRLSQDSISPHKQRNNKPMKKTRPSFSPSHLPNEPTVQYSQTAIEGAEVLIDLAGNKFMTVPTEDGCVATRVGIERLLHFRSNNLSKKRKSPGISSPDESSKKMMRKGSPGDQKFHLTQADDDLTLTRWVSPLNRTETKKEQLPLEGFCFFGSGIDVSIADAVSRLGGKFLNEVKGDALKRSNVVKKLFFLSDIVNRRTHKYLLACVLGVPMLHYKWVHVLEHKFEEYRSQKDAMSNVHCPSIFDSQLYSAYRLPLGLSTESNLYVLQRASHAKRWKGALSNDGTLIFLGLTIVVTLDSAESEKKWVSILEQTGAQVLKGSQIHENTQVDLILTDSILLPPHVTAAAPKISKVVNKIITIKPDTPIVDLSWATQCIVRREKIALSDEYTLRLGKLLSAANENKVTVHSMKVKQSCGLTRYEVGDCIKFGKKNKNQSHGRIISIHFDRRSNKKSVEVGVLELHNQCELMDGGKNVSTIFIDESELQGHIVILGGKEYSQVQWSESSRVFVQKKK